MDLQDILNLNKEIQHALLDFFDNEDQDSQLFDKLTKIINQRILKNREETILFFHMLLAIVNYHHRMPFFFSKIEKILLVFKDEIEQTFTNHEIFDFFQKSKPILLYLLRNDMITIDEYIFEKLNESYSSYLLPYLGSYSVKNRKYEENVNIERDEFVKMQEAGENEQYLCELVRKDSVIEFVKYVTKNNIKLNRLIMKSIFETNLFLMDRITFLNEYAAFYGSLKIINYLVSKQVKLAPSMWIFAIHGRSIKVIHFLEEKKVLPKNSSFIDCLNEALKCFHNEIADYFIYNYINEFRCSLNYNFDTLNDEINKYQCVFILFQNSKFDIIKNLIQNKSLDPLALNNEIINQKKYFINIISKSIFVFNVISKSIFEMEFQKFKNF